MHLRFSACLSALACLTLCGVPSPAATHHKKVRQDLGTLVPQIIADQTAATAIGNLIQAKDGNFYGVTNNLSASAPAGTLYMVTPAGQYSTVYTFGGNGQAPAGAVFQGKDGNLYGLLTDNTNVSSADTTLQGSLFVYNIARKALVGAGIYALPENGGESLTQDAAGNLYGVSTAGTDIGDIFKVTINASPNGSYPPPAPTITVIYTFGEGDAVSGAGAYPNGTPVIASDGMLYGTTTTGPFGGSGTAYQYDLSSPTAKPQPIGGGFATVRATNPAGGMAEVNDGNLYGVVNNQGTAALYQLSLSALTLSVVHTYGANENQQVPYGTPGVFENQIYTAGTGGINGQGTITEVEIDNTDVESTPLYAFTGGTDGGNPMGDPLIAGVNGDIASVGATSSGGTSSDGTVYALGEPAPPPVTLTTSNTVLEAGAPITLNYELFSAYSISAQTCFAFSSDGTFSGSVALNSSGTGTVNVTPANTGTHQYAITCGGGQSAVLNLSVIKGNVSLADTSNTPLSSASINFGAVPEGSIASQTIVLTNNATIAFPFAVTITGKYSAHFSATSTCGSSVPAGGSCDITFSYDAPAGAETDSAIYTIGRQGFTFSPDNTGTLSAHSSAPGVVTLSATSHNFGNVTEFSSASYTFQVYNGTGAAQSFSQTVTVAGSDSTGYFSTATTCPATLAVNQACSVTVTFMPTRTGAYTAQVTVTSSASVKPAGVVTLTANVISPGCSKPAQC